MSTVTCLCSYCKAPSVSALLTNASLFSWFAASLASPDKIRRTALPPSSNTALLGPSLLDSNSHDCFQSRGLPDVGEVRGNAESAQLLSGRLMPFDLAHYHLVLLYMFFFFILARNEDKQEVSVSNGVCRLNQASILSIERVTHLLLLSFDCFLATGGYPAGLYDEREQCRLHRPLQWPRTRALGHRANPPTSSRGLMQGAEPVTVRIEQKNVKRSAVQL